MTKDPKPEPNKPASGDPSKAKPNDRPLGSDPNTQKDPTDPRVKGK
jgi:hypothetical protein